MAEKLALCFYFDADNDLENNIVNNVMDAFDADLSSGNLDVYIYLDRSNKYGVYQKIHTTSGKVEKDGFDKYLTEIQKNNPWVTDPDKPKPIANKACYLKISYDEGEGENVLTVEKDLGAQDSGSKQTVTDFLNWCAGQCTDATKKILLMADHGSGLERSFNDETIGSALLPQAVADAIKASAWKSVDVLMDDACLMANAEGISNLSGVATYMVASEDFVGGSGCAYEAMLTALNGLDPESSDDYTPQALADLLVESNNDSDRTKIGAVTLSSLNLNNAQKAAMNAFADASDNFTNADWSKQAKAFANYEHVYQAEMHFVDFLSVLNDTELQSGISGALQTALTDLKTALEGIISSKMEDTTQLGEGLTVMSPIRADQQKLPDLYQYLAMTDVGNSSVWTQFTLKLHAVAKEAGLISDNLPENTLNFVVPTRNFSATVPINTTTTTITTVQAPKRSLGPLGITSGLVFDHLQYVTKTEPQWYFFRVFKTDENTFSELTLDFSQATVKNTFTVTVYGEDTTTGKYTVTKDAWSFSENADGKVVIDLSTLDLNPDKYMNYAIRVYSADATTEYSMKYMLTDGSSHEIKAKSVDLLDDMVNESQNNNSADTAFSLDGNYYSGMTVYSGYSDWYQTNLLDCSITVKVYDSNTDLSTTPTLNVEQQNSDLEQIGIAGGVYNTGTGNWEYTFDHFVPEDDDRGCYLKISVNDTNNFYYYNITVNNRKKDPDYCTKILSTDVCKSEETGRSTLCWEAASLSKQNFLRLSSDNFRTALNCTVKTFTTQIYNSTSDLKWSVRNDEMLDEDEKPYWVTSDTKITADAAATGAKQVVAINDCVTDILLAHADGTWGGLYYAQHVGFKNGWNGTEEQVSLNGKTRITDVFTGGGTDSAMLFLTDASNGDALFVDDIYSAFGDAVRLTNLTDVFAGAGKDILDFTSQRYEYAPSESEISLHGGDGDDVIWGPNTASKLFGDNGNDRIVGGSGDDLIVGGEGNNDLHGGGGNDTFCFYNNPDDVEKNTVTQLDGGSVILWFDKDVVGEWDEETLTFTYSYEDEENKSTVVVKGVEDDDISIRIGDHDYDDTEVLYADKYAELVKENAFAENSSNRIYVTA